MMAPSRPSAAPHSLSRQARQRFVEALEGCIPALATETRKHFSELMMGGVKMASLADRRVAMEAAEAFQSAQQNWTEATRKAWRKSLDNALNPLPERGADSGKRNMFTLEDEAVSERKILASRLANAVTESAGTDINNLKLRIQYLEQTSDWASQDILRPETLSADLIQAWLDSGLKQPMWELALPAIRPVLAKQMTEAYKAVNDYLIQNGIMVEINLKSLVRRDRQGDAGPGGGPASPRARAPAPRPPQDPSAQTYGPADQQYGAVGPAYGPAEQPYDPAGQAYGPAGQTYDPAGQAYGAAGQPYGPAGQVYGPAGQAYGPAGGQQFAPAGRPRGVFRGRRALPPAAGRVRGEPPHLYAPTVYMPPPDARQGPMGDTVYVRDSELARTDLETRMATNPSPLARIRERAQGVFGQLRRMLTDRVAGYADTVATSVQRLSPRLARELDKPITFPATMRMEDTEGNPIGPVPTAQVRDMAVRLRQRANELKSHADKPSEKAIIEIVALMFQAILAEERIPSSIRVWFARLQIPVLRLALAEPDFFASVTHPARQLIDCMGSCALGFDATQISTYRLESEVKRIVQVIEQYPETGRRVYHLVLKEFKKFIGRSLTETEAVQQVATLAQQIEQKEALSVQYTIELHRMLASVPVGDTVREFLFRVWADVLAMAAVRHGPQHAETLRFKQAAADLLRSVSPRSDAAEHERLVQQFANVIIVLREGMTTLAIPCNKQSDYVKRLTDGVEQAFAPENNSISQATLDDLAHQLAKLEDVVNDDSEGEVLLDPHMIDLMFGSEGNALEVISTGGLPPTEDMLQWTHEQELGAWFSLDHKGMVSLAQYVWHSARGQLHLLNSSDGKSYLMQTHQFAAYLQAGLLTPVEDETLTARATRQALAQISTESAPLQ